MNTHQSVKKVDERTHAVASQGIAWAHSFITIALLVDVICRRLVLHEMAWDLFALLGASGAISMVYMIRHKGWDVGESFGWRVAIIYAVALVALASIGFVLAMAKPI
jgi:hypothetical protein